jgi:hypothetical protein
MGSLFGFFRLPEQAPTFHAHRGQEAQVGGGKAGGSATSFPRRYRRSGASNPDTLRRKNLAAQTTHCAHRARSLRRFHTQLDGGCFSASGARDGFAATLRLRNRTSELAEKRTFQPCCDNACRPATRVPRNSRDAHQPVSDLVRYKRVSYLIEPTAGIRGGACDDSAGPGSARCGPTGVAEDAPAAEGTDSSQPPGAGFDGVPE